MNQLLLIIKREYLTKVRNKSFIIMTFLSPLIFTGLILLVAYLSRINNEEKQEIRVIDETHLFANEFHDFESFHFIKADDQSDFEQVKREISKAEGYGLLLIEKPDALSAKPKVYFYSDDAPSMSLLNYMQKTIENKAFEENLERSGVNLRQLNEASANINITVENFSGEESSKTANILKLIFGGAAGYFLMMFIIIYGNMIMRSVIEEKTSRIIEIIISSVKPRKLMMGKIIGTSLAGISQFLVWLLLGVILVTIISAIFHINVFELETPQKAMLENSGAADIMVREGLTEFFKLPLFALVVSFFLYFVGGYLLYSSIYVSIGAAVDSETDTQQFMMPVIMVLMLGVYVGFFTVINNPHGTVATIFSFIPFTSPIVMLMRIPFGVDLWEIALSLVILYITFTGVVWLAAKIYRVGILMYGKKPTYKELYKWLKY